MFDWKRFAIHLPTITRADIEAIATEQSTIQNIKLSLYSKWLNKFSNASWKDVREALKAIDEHTLAAEI